MARWQAEFLNRGSNIQNNAAGVGIVCHGALEDFVRAVFMRKEKPWDWAVLEELFHENYDKVFGADRSIPEYKDAHNIVFNWFMRDEQYEYLSTVKILSLESKNSFPVKGHDPFGDTKVTVPFNYVMDRVDRISDTEVKVVDYKTNRHPLTEAQLRDKKQARYYALAIQIVWPKTEKITVEFDFLRHRPVSTVFTRDDQIVTWHELVRSLQAILDTPEDRTPETLNPMCGYCIRKSSCKALQSNIAAGGIFSHDLGDLVALYSQLESQKKAQDLLMGEIELLLLNHAIQEGVTDYEVNGAKVEVKLPTRRSINNEIAAAVLGPSASQYANFTVTQVLKLIGKNSPLPPPQRELLREAIEIKESDPTVKITPVSGFND